MPLTLDQLTDFLDRNDLSSIQDSRRGITLLNFGGLTGTLQVVILLEDDGMYFRFRTMQLALLPPSHPALGKVVALLNEMNLTKRLVRFAIDPRDGEIIAEAAMWLLDGEVTDSQLGVMLKAFVLTIDLGRGRIRCLLDGKDDPGDDMAAVVAASGGMASLPEEVRKALEAASEESDGPEEI